MTLKEEILEILRYTNSIKNNEPLLRSQCEFLEELLSRSDLSEDSGTLLLIKEALSEYAEKIYSTERMVDVRFQYAISLLYKTSNYTECLIILSELLKIPNIEQHPSYLQILLEMGSVHSILSKFEEAKLYFQKAEKLSQSNSEDSFRIVAKQANILHKQQKHQEAISLLKSLLDSFATISPNIIAGVCLTLGTIYSKLQNTEQSFYYFQKASELRDVNNYEFGVVLNNNLGNLYSRLNDFEQSVLYFEQSLQFAIKTEKIDLQIGSYVNLASIEIQRENFKVAQFLLENASHHIKEIPKSYITLRVNERLAYVYIHSAEDALLSTAKNMIEQTIKDSIELQLDDLLASAYWVYSHYFKRKNLHNEQLDNLIKSYTLSFSRNNLFMEFLTTMEITEYYIQQNNIKAKEFLEKAQKSFSQLHKGYQESKIATLYILNADVAIIENKIEDVRYFYNKLVSLPIFSNELEIRNKILKYKTYLQI